MRRGMMGHPARGDIDSDESIEEDIVRDVMKESVIDSNMEQDSQESGVGKPMARFVRDITMPDSSIVQPGRTFQKSWLVRNDGDVAWPADTRLSFASGDDLSAEAHPISTMRGVVLPGHETEITVSLTAPSQEGRFVSYFRLQHGDSDSAFGQRFWCDVRVARPSEEDENCGDCCAADDTAISQAIAEAISSVISDETTPHEALGKLLRTWTMVNHSDAPPASPPSSDEVATSAEPACAMPDAPLGDVEAVLVRDNTEGHEDDWRRLWSHEVTLLEAMGFGDAIGAALPLLQQFLGTPLSLTVAGPDGTSPVINAEGFQKVVIALLGVRARHLEAAEAAANVSSSGDEASISEFVGKVSA